MAATLAKNPNGLTEPLPDDTEQHPDSKEDETEYLKGKALWLVVIGVLLSIFLMALDAVCP